MTCPRPRGIGGSNEPVAAALDVAGRYVVFRGRGLKRQMSPGRCTRLASTRREALVRAVTGDCVTSVSGRTGAEELTMDSGVGVRRARRIAGIMQPSSREARALV
jgi:hypothetical protein